MAWLLQTDLMIAAEAPAKAAESLATATALLPAQAIDSNIEITQLCHYHAAWRHWLEDDLLLSARAFESALLLCPADVFALKRAQLLYFLGGKPDDMLRVSDFMWI